eukprot:SAG11_NODE_10745_length_808_cov_1.033850_1_plen_160_part_01
MTTGSDHPIEENGWGKRPTRRAWFPSRSGLRLVDVVHFDILVLQPHHLPNILGSSSVSSSWSIGEGAEAVAPPSGLSVRVLPRRAGPLHGDPAAEGYAAAAARRRLASQGRHQRQVRPRRHPPPPLAEAPRPQPSARRCFRCSPCWWWFVVVVLLLLLQL